MNPNQVAMILQTRQLALRQGKRVLIESLDLCIEPGQIWCVLGRNGCGKTTLLRTLAGLRAPDAGEVLFDQRPLPQWDWRQLAQVRALLPQKVNDVFSATVLETVMTGRFPHQGTNWHRHLGFDAASDERLALACLDELGIADLAQRDVLTLSGGERQRVAIAALLTQTPQIALLDEPLAHLDLDVQRRVMDVLCRRAGQGLGLILSLHDVNLAERYATHVLLFLEEGAVVVGHREEVLQADTLTHAYRHPVRRFEQEGLRWFVAY